MMAARRIWPESGFHRPDQPEDKMTVKKPSLASVIGEVMVINSLHNLSSAVEPLFRRVVSEELERALRRRAVQPTPPSPAGLHLVFTNQPRRPVFTGTGILGNEGSPLRIRLVDAAALPVSLPFPVKLHVVVLYGDFCPSVEAGGAGSWSREEFRQGVVRERAGRQPLLAGDVRVTLRDGVAAAGELKFTDNSSWVRSRRFRIGVTAASETDAGIPIREAVTEAFAVKDRRGELYRKHRPPSLEDEVWRVDKIGKDGVFHRRLSDAGVHTVQDLLKLYVVDAPRLREILGFNVSDRTWETMTSHAKTCIMGNKFYVYRRPNSMAVFNPICEVMMVTNGHPYKISHPTGNVEELAKEAYGKWKSLEVIDSSFFTQAICNFPASG